MQDSFGNVILVALGIGTICWWAVPQVVEGAKRFIVQLVHAANEIAVYTKGGKSGDQEVH